MRKEFVAGSSIHDEVAFTVKGTDRTSGEPFEEEFRCLPDAPGTALVMLLGAIDGSLALRAGAVISFLDAVLVPEDEARFRVLIQSKDRLIPVETLGEIMDWLVEAYANRPTPPPSGSPDGASGTKD